MKHFRKYFIGIAGIIFLLGLCYGTWGREHGDLYSERDKGQEVFSIEGKASDRNENNAALREKDNSSTVKKTAYLTFDDGPSPYTEKIIEILRQEEACATFFLIGQQISDEEVPVLKKLMENGNEIGIHTYSHEESIYASKTAFLKDFRMARSAIKDKLGIEPKIYRFPWGSTSKYVKPIKKEVTSRLAQCGYQYEDWNVSAEDSIGRPGKDAIIANIQKDFAKHEEPVILMHDSLINEETVKALPQIIHMIKEEGYSFGILSERSEPMQY